MRKSSCTHFILRLLPFALRHFPFPCWSLNVIRFLQRFLETPRERWRWDMNTLVRHAPQLGGWNRRALRSSRTAARRTQAIASNPPASTAYAHRLRL